MIDPATVYGAAAAVTAAALVALLPRLRRVPVAQRTCAYPVAAVVGLSAVLTGLTAADLGVVTVGGTDLQLFNILDDLVGYAVLWVVAGLLAGESRRTLAILGLIPAVQVVSFYVASVAGGVVGLVCLLVVVGGHGLIAYLLLGPIWRRTERLPDARRLLHWKARNLLLFLVGMLIAFALLSVAGAFDGFVTAVIGAYMAVLIRVGFAAFLFANLDALETDGAASPAVPENPDRAPGDAPGDPAAD